MSDTPTDRPPVGSPPAIGEGSDPAIGPGRAPRASWRRRFPALLALGAVAAAIAAAVLTTVGHGHGHAAPSRLAVRAAPAAAPAHVAAPRPRAPASATTIAFRETGSRLPHALAGSAAAVVGSANALLMGGIDAAGASSDRTVEIDAGRVAGRSRLPRALRYAEAASIAGTVYLLGGEGFGGGGTQTGASILQVDPAGGTQVVGQLPMRVAEAGVAVVGGTAFLVGGSDGTQALNTIVSWQPGLNAHVVAQLPQALRFPAVAAVGGEVIIAGGTTAHGPSRSLLGFDPNTGQVTGLTVLPTPVTHAAAAVLNGLMYVLGGEVAGPGTQTDHIEVFDPQTATVTAAGLLPTPLSDASAVSETNTILLAGGVDDAGQVHDQIYEGVDTAGGTA